MEEKKGRKSANCSFQTATTFYDSSSEDEESGCSTTGGSYAEMSSTYQINKMLSSEQYLIGKNIQHYLKCFEQQYKSIHESAALLPQPINGITLMVNETVNSLTTGYNLGKQRQFPLHKTRPWVEKYIYQKLFDQLFAMYAIKNCEMDSDFVEKAREIKKNQSAHEAMVYLGINKKFIITDTSLPYAEAIREIEKMQACSSPREMLDCLSAAYGQLKSVAVDHHRGKLELVAMDDILPLSIYMVAMS